MLAKFSAKQWIVAAGVATGVATATTVSFALWSGSGAGNGTASSRSAQGVTVTATTGAADLYPGFTAGDVFFTITNPNPYPLTFTAFAKGAIVSSDTTACPSANVTVVDTAPISVSVAANAVNEPHSIADVVTMIGAAPDGCQNKQFTIPLTLTGSQS